MSAAVEEGDDPFTAFDAFVGAVPESPYPQWADLRSRGSLVADDTGDTDLLQALMRGDRPAFTAVTHEAVVGVLRDGATFSSSCFRDTMGALFGHSLLEMDDPEHRRYRAIIERSFSKAAAATATTEIVEPAVASLVAPMRGRGRAELVKDFDIRLPMLVLADILGLPRSDRNRFHRWSLAAITLSDMDGALTAAAELDRYLGAVIAERRRRPRPDLITELTRHQIDGGGLMDEEILAFLRFLLPAGAETVYRALGNLFFALLTHPEQLDAVRADPTLVPAAVEEALRWEPPLTGLWRTTLSAVSVCGASLPPGASVFYAAGSANRDGCRWGGSADDFDIHRERRPHLSFAHGSHVCIGQHLARAQLTASLHGVLALPNLRLDPEHPSPFISGTVFRSPPELHIVFDPPEPATTVRRGSSTRRQEPRSR